MFKGRVPATHHATDATWSKWVALTTQRAQIGKPSRPGVLEVIMDCPEGKDFGTSLEEEVMHAEEAPLYNKLLENEKQYALFTDGSCCIVGKHQRWNSLDTSLDCDDFSNMIDGKGRRGMGVAVSSSHVVSAAPSSSGKGLLTLFPAPEWGPSHERQSCTNFSNVSPSRGLQFFMDCSGMRPFHGVQSFRNRLLQHGSPAGSQVLPAKLLQCGLPMGSQPPLGIHLLQRGVLHGLQVHICSTVNLHGLQGDSLPHRGLLHKLQGNLCSGTCSISSSSFFTDLDTKVSEEGGGGGAPGAGAEILLQVKIDMVRQAVPLQPIEVNSIADIHLQPVEDPTPEQVHARRGDCDTVGSPSWSRLLAGPVNLWRKEPMLEQFCWQDL
ncbi:hypothetical protein QYF61_012492 [Mycteria americana]|uniref:Uncharacterized protein n=1 Tax=Mycteria americana TaxID=33587 RepID=A0AAN7NUD6_MYCAM|nr:hypothetical protein QYF61_012492 [Mycteria americana]